MAIFAYTRQPDWVGRFGLFVIGLLAVLLAVGILPGPALSQDSPLSPVGTPTGDAPQGDVPRADVPGPVSPLPAEAEATPSAEPTPVLVLREPPPAPANASSPLRPLTGTDEPGEIPLGEPLRAQTSLYLIAAILLGFVALIFVVVVRRGDE